MRKTFEAALADLIAEYAEDRDAIIDALESQLMAVREADGDDG